VSAEVDAAKQQTAAPPKPSVETQEIAAEDKYTNVGGWQ